MHGLSRKCWSALEKSGPRQCWRSAVAYHIHQQQLLLLATHLAQPTSPRNRYEEYRRAPLHIHSDQAVLIIMMSLCIHTWCALVMTLGCHYA